MSRRPLSKDMRGAIASAIERERLSLPPAPRTVPTLPTLRFMTNEKHDRRYPAGIITEEKK